MQICIHFGHKEIGISGLEVISAEKRLFVDLHLPQNAEKNDRKDLPGTSGRGDMDHLQYVLLSSDPNRDYSGLSNPLIPWRKPWESSEAVDRKMAFNDACINAYKKIKKVSKKKIINSKKINETTMLEFAPELEQLNLAGFYHRILEKDPSPNICMGVNLI